MESKLKIAVYTVIIGPYDGLIPPPSYANIDYICFTDQPFRSKKWQIRKVKIENNDPVRTARKIKIQPHLYLPEYEHSVFVDGNYVIKKNLEILVKHVLQYGPMGIFDHNQCSDPRNCVYDEYEAIIHLQNQRAKLKDDPAIMDQQMMQYRKEGYPEKNGLIFSAALVRQHHHPKVKETMKCWWQQIEQFSKRDQLGFNYAAWKTNFQPYYISGDLRRHEYFHLLSKHRPDYRWKYLKYRLKRIIGLI